MIVDVGITLLGFIQILFSKLNRWLCQSTTRFDCVFLSCHRSVKSVIYTLHVPKCQETPCPK